MHARRLGRLGRLASRPRRLAGAGGLLCPLGSTPDAARGEGGLGAEPCAWSAVADGGAGVISSRVCLGSAVPWRPLLG